MRDETGKVELGEIESTGQGMGYVAVRRDGCGGIVAKFPFFQSSDQGKAVAMARWFVSFRNAWVEATDKM